MNVIISNELNELLSALNIDVMKKVQGVFTVDEIVDKFANFYFNRIIIDITAIKDYKNVKNLQSLSINLDADKIVILLDGSVETSSPEYVSSLISMGLYNFTKNAEGIMYLVNHSNTYKDVASLHQIDRKPEEVVSVGVKGARVLGFKNVTDHAGSTSLIYMLKRQLSKNYRVLAIEINKKDFMYYNDLNMISTTENDFGKELLKANGNADIILVDINDSAQENACGEVIYLIEPSTIKINKLISKNREMLKRISNKKVILNKCALSSNDISEFEMEAEIKTFYAIPPLNDRLPSKAIDNLLIKMGFLKQRIDPNEGESNKILGIFKHKS